MEASTVRTITAESEIAVFDPDRVEELVRHAYEQAGYTKIDREGEIVLDEDKLKAKVFETFTSKVVTSKSDKSNNSWTQGELYARVFPGAPGTDPKTADQLDLIDGEVRSKLVRRTWNLTNPNRTGYIQKRLEEKGSLILCRAKVMRGLDEQLGAFITDNADLIMSDSMAPRVEKLVKEADNLRAHATMITRRHPELENKVTAAIGSGVKRTVAALPKPSSNGAGKKDAGPANADTASDEGHSA